MIQELQEISQVVNDILLFEKKRFSRRVSLDYKAISSQPWLNLECKSDDDLSFRIHDLEFGENNQGESAFLHASAQREKKFKFDGFINPLSVVGFKGIRGYLSVPEHDYRLGVVANNGRVTKLKTQAEREKSLHILAYRILPLLIVCLGENDLPTKFKR